MKTFFDLTTVARAADPSVRRTATDGGVVTALLLHLLERGRIDGAIVTQPAGAYRRRPFLATSTEDIKDNLMVHLKNGAARSIPLDSLEFMRRHACRYCPDYSSEFADVSFGGLGAEEGWTTVITRTPLGRAAFADAAGAGKLEAYSLKANPNYASQALAKVRSWSAKKRKTAQKNRKNLTAKGVYIKSGAA